jgi:hypothetical protein
MTVQTVANNESVGPSAFDDKKSEILSLIDKLEAVLAKRVHNAESALVASVLSAFRNLIEAATEDDFKDGE